METSRSESEIVRQDKRDSHLVREYEQQCPKMGQPQNPERHTHWTNYLPDCEKARFCQKSGSTALSMISQNIITFTPLFEHPFFNISSTMAAAESTALIRSTVVSN